MLKRCIALAVAAFLLLVPAYAKDFVRKTWLDDGETWLCEEHHVLYDAGFPDNYCRQCSFASRVQTFAINSAAESADIPYHSGGTDYFSSFMMADNGVYSAPGFDGISYNFTFSSATSYISTLDGGSSSISFSGYVWFYFEASFVDLITQVNYWQSSYSVSPVVTKVVHNDVTGFSGMWLGFYGSDVWPGGGFNFSLSSSVSDVSMTSIYYWDNQSDFNFPDPPAPPDPPDPDDPYLDLPVAPSLSGGYQLNASDPSFSFSYSSTASSSYFPLSYVSGYYSGSGNSSGKRCESTVFRFDGASSSFSSYIWIGFDVYLSGYDVTNIYNVLLQYGSNAKASSSLSVYDLGLGYYRIWAAFDFSLLPYTSMGAPLRLVLAHATDSPVLSDVAISDIYCLVDQQLDSSPPTIGSVTGGGSGSGSGSGGSSGGSFFRPVSPPTKSDRWIDKQFSGAVNPTLPSKLQDAQSGIDQMDDFEEQLWEDYEQYLDEVDPSLITFPTSFISAMIWIGGFFGDLFDGLGEWQFIITFPMFLGLALLVLGRGTQAMASTSARHMRWNARQQAKK